MAPLPGESEMVQVVHRFVRSLHEGTLAVTQRTPAQSIAATLRTSEVGAQAERAFYLALTASLAVEALSAVLQHPTVRQIAHHDPALNNMITPAVIFALTGVREGLIGPVGQFLSADPAERDAIAALTRNTVRDLAAECGIVLTPSPSATGPGPEQVN